MAKLMIAYYSEQQRQSLGLFEFIAEDNSIIQCTCIGDIRGEPPNYPDVKMVGQVKKYLRTVELVKDKDRF